MSELVSTTGRGALADNLPDHSSEKFYLTTAIAYTNGAPHIGHAYEFVSSDVIVRFHRVFGFDTYFLTGSDEHGQKVAASAEKAGLSPLQHCDGHVASFKALHTDLLITYSQFIRTTDAYHEETSRRLWVKCHSKGDIYLDSYEGWYNEREEVFVTEMEAEANDFKDPGSGIPLKRVQEASYFFRMSNYTEKLIAFIESNPSFIEPEQYRNNILGRLKKEGLKDLSISRTTFSWGIAVPEGFDAAHVMYVWFDALTNYLSGVHALDTDHPLSPFWPANTHIIGKDIVWFHAVIWPCMLMSAELPLPERVFAHGFVNAGDGRKMSKSYNNAVDPSEIRSKYSVDTIRYYMCASTTYGADVNFSEDALIAMHNAELADVLGNLVHRALNLCQKYCEGVVPDSVHVAEFGLPFDVELLNKSVMEDMKRLAIHGAVFKAMEAARATNKFLTDAEPWKMKKVGDAPRRAAVVRTVLEAVFVFTHYLAPAIPLAAQAIFEKLHTAPVSTCNLRRDLYNLVPGTPVSVGDILFQKIEISGSDATAEAEISGALSGAASGANAQKGKKGKGSAPAAAKEVEEIHTLDFTKLDLRVGVITKIWAHEKSDTLFCEEIDIGEGEPRSICSGLRNFYKQDDLLGKQVIVVANMKESKFKGFPSKGMVLAAKSADGSTVELVCPPAAAVLGSRVLLTGPGLDPTLLSVSPFSPEKVKKQKVFEAVAPDLHTNDGKFVCWKEYVLCVDGVECTVPTLASAQVS